MFQLRAQRLNQIIFDSLHNRELHRMFFFIENKIWFNKSLISIGKARLRSGAKFHKESYFMHEYVCLSRTHGNAKPFYICRLHFHATRFIMKNSSECWMRWTSNAAHQIRIDCSGHFYDCKKPYHPLIQSVSMPYSNWFNRSRRTPADFIPFPQKLTFRTCVSNPTLYRMQNPLFPVWILAIQHSRLQTVLSNMTYGYGNSHLHFHNRIQSNFIMKMCTKL